MAGAGDSALRVSRNQSSVLRGTYRTTLGKGVAFAQTGELPSWAWVLACRDSRRPQRRYDDGLYAAGRVDDGHAIGLGGPRHPDVLDAAELGHWAAARRFAQHQIWFAGDLRNFRRHAKD